MTNKVAQVCNQAANAVARNATLLDWGVRFTLDNELDALRVAYAHRNAPGGVKCEYLEVTGEYAVTIFNKDCPAGIDRS
jgi:hypothetical protein